MPDIHDVLWGDVTLIENLSIREIETITEYFRDDVLDSRAEPGIRFSPEAPGRVLMAPDEIDALFKSGKSAAEIVLIARARA